MTCLGGSVHLPSAGSVTSSLPRSRGFVGLSGPPLDRAHSQPGDWGRSLEEWSWAGRMDTGLLTHGLRHPPVKPQTSGILDSAFLQLVPLLLIRAHESGEGTRPQQQLESCVWRKAQRPAQGRAGQPAVMHLSC